MYVVEFPLIICLANKDNMKSITGQRKRDGLSGSREEEGTLEEGMVFFLLVRQRATGVQDVGQEIV